MTETIMYKSQYGVTYQSVETVTEEVKSYKGKETYNVSAPNIGVFKILSKDKPTVGDLMTRSSSEFEIDALEGVYLNEANAKHDIYESTVVATFVAFDGSTYIPEQSRNGGAYLHTWYEIQQVLDVEYQE